MAIFRTIPEVCGGAVVEAQRYKPEGRWIDLAASVV
jgi:hypothetical protein